MWVLELKFRSSGRAASTHRSCKCSSMEQNRAATGTLVQDFSPASVLTFHTGLVLRKLWAAERGQGSQRLSSSLWALVTFYIPAEGLQSNSGFQWQTTCFSMDPGVQEDSHGQNQCKSGSKSEEVCDKIREHMVYHKGAATAQFQLCTVPFRHATARAS